MLVFGRSASTVRIAEPADSDRDGSGATIAVMSVHVAARVAIPMEVTRWEPPRRVDVRHLGRVVRGTGTFTVSPAPGGAWLSWAEDLDLPLGALGRLGFALVRPAFELMLRRSLARLARHVEGRRGGPGPRGGG